jgi:hypothetical protein
MGKKPGRKSNKRKSIKKRSARHRAMAKHSATLLRATRTLQRRTTALVGTSARQLVYSLLGEPLTLPDTTPLSKLGYDWEALAGLAAEIRAHGVNVDTGAVQLCKTIADLIKVVAAA